jgi:GTP-binding protein
LIADLIKEDDRITIAKGGQGGLGNSQFKSSTNQAPRQFTEGENQEEKWIWLSLKLFADIGIVGMPNAGKSTLLMTISAAQPKIADYPFTTLHPILGVVKKFDQEFVIADIPGLIKGAHEGKGLGDQFLAHIERCKILLHVIDCSQKNFEENYSLIKDEIIKYDKNLNNKIEIIALSKFDLSDISQDNLKKIIKNKTGKIPFIFSSHTKEGISNLVKELYKESKI